NPSGRGAAGHLQQEMHAGNLEAVLQKAELHVLTAEGCLAINLGAIVPQLFDHVRVDLGQPTVLHAPKPFNYNEMSVSVLSPEKAGVVGSIPSLATIQRSICSSVRK